MRRLRRLNIALLLIYRLPHPLGACLADARSAVKQTSRPELLAGLQIHEGGHRSATIKAHLRPRVGGRFRPVDGSGS